MRTHRWSGISVEGLENLSRWLGAVAERPGVQRGVKVPVDIAELMDAQKKADADAFSSRARTMVVGADDSSD